MYSEGTENYYIESQVTRAGTYRVHGSVLSKGSFLAIFYSKPDFSEFYSYYRLQGTEEVQGGAQILFDEYIEPDFFDKYTTQYSIMLEGAIRHENSTLHNLTFETNYKMKVYFNEQLMLYKDDLLTRQMQLIDFYAESARIYRVQIMLWIDQVR